MAQGFRTCLVASLRVPHERPYSKIALYQALKTILVKGKIRFRIMPKQLAHRWDLALALNLAFWTPEGEGDIVLSDRVEPDVLAHVAWHHLANLELKKLGSGATAEDMLLGESIASAFDLYLVGMLLRTAPSAPFLREQIPIMSETCSAWGLSSAKFAHMLQGIADDPETAFEDLRQLLFDTATKVAACDSARAALKVFADANAHRFAPLLHRYELPNWVLYTRAYGKRGRSAARRIDMQLRTAQNSLDWLQTHWVLPAAMRR